MKKILYRFVPVLLVVLMASCNGNPFMSNIFSGIDVYSLPDSFSSTDEILDEAGDDAFLDALTEDPELTAEVIDILDDVLAENPAGATSEDQEAALLLADIYLTTSGADDTLNGLNDLAGDLASGDTSAFDSIESESDVLGLFFSADQSQDNVEGQLAALLGASDAYSFYGETIETAGSSVELDEGEKTVVAVTAAVTGITDYLVTNLAGENPTEAERDAAIAQIADSIVNGTTLTLNDDPGLTDAEDPIAYMLGDGIFAVVNDGLPDLESLMAGFGG